MITLSQVKTKRLLAVHGWSGTLLGLLLYVVIITGTVAVLASEIGRWSVGGASHNAPVSTVSNEQLATLTNTVDPSYLDEISIFGNSAGNLVYFFHTHGLNSSGQPDDLGRMLEYHPLTNELVRDREGFGSDLFGTDPESALDAFIVDLHVKLHIADPWGVYITGILGFVMLIAASTGLLIHRHLLKDIFVAPRYSSALLHKRDRHVLAGSWALPFAFVLALTGAFYSFALALGFPVVTKSAFAGDRVAMIETLVGASEAADPSPKELVNINTLVDDAKTRAQTEALSIIISRYGRADSEVSIIHQPREGQLSSQKLIYDGDTGEFLRRKPIVGTRPSAGNLGYTLMSSLHFGDFAGLLSKFAWVSLGLAMSYVTLSGMRLWIERRSGSLLWRRFGVATTIVGYGTPLALVGAAYGFFFSLGSETSQFWTPVGFIATAAVAICAGIAWRNAKRLKQYVCLVLGVSLVLLPLVRLISVGDGWGVSSRLDPIVITLDLVVLATGFACLKAAFSINMISFLRLMRSSGQHTA